MFLFYLTWKFWKGTRHSLPQALEGRKGREGKRRREGTGEERRFTEARGRRGEARLGRGLHC